MRPSASPARFTTREVILVTPRTGGFARACGGGALCGLYPGLVPDEPLAGLRRVSERSAANGRFLLVRYRSAQPVSVSEATLPAFGQQAIRPGPDAGLSPGLAPAARCVDGAREQVGDSPAALSAQLVQAGVGALGGGARRDEGFPEPRPRGQ